MIGLVATRQECRVPFGGGGGGIRSCEGCGVDGGFIQADWSPLPRWRVIGFSCKIFGLEASKG